MKKIHYTVSTFILTSLVAVGCGASSHPVHPAERQRPLLSEEDICPPWSPDESGTDGNPQSRSYRGGCLGNFRYFHASGDATPPGALPERVTGHHYELGDLEIELSSTKVDTAASTGVVPLHDVRAMTVDGPINLCRGQRYEGGEGGTDGNADLDERAIAVPGAWDPRTGGYRETVGGKRVFTLACMSGVAAKCVHWGYPPWGTYQGEPLSGYFQACVKAARAAYDGHGAHTCAGTEIHVADRLGIRQVSEAAAGLSLEAAWGKDGPACISNPRFPACAEEEAVRRSEVCDEAALSGDKDGWPEGVLLVTRSTADHAARLNQCPSKPGICL